MSDLPIAPKDSIYFENDKLYVALAMHPLANGHSVVVWRDKISDLSELSKDDYEYLMDFVDVARNTLIDFYGVEKVYLLYMDEVEHVHWHLVPRFNEEGINALNHAPGEMKEFKDTKDLEKLFKQKQDKFL